MLSKISQFVKPRRENLTGFGKEFSFRKFLSNFFYGAKKHKQDIMLFMGVVLISLFSFAAGYITAKYQEKEPIQFIEKSNISPSQVFKENLGGQANQISK